MEGPPAKYFSCNHSEELTPTITISILGKLEQQIRRKERTTACRACLSEGRGLVPVFDEPEDGFPIPLCTVCRVSAVLATHVAPGIVNGTWDVNQTRHRATE